MRRALLLLLAALCVAGCSGSSPDADGGRSPSASQASPTPEETGTYQEVEFTGGDGEPRQGRVFGRDDAPVGVVLSHMGRDGDSQDDWAATAQALSERGHRVLTYQRLRPRYQVWQDVVGAVEQLRDDGAEHVVVAGASIGAMASLHVAQAGEPEVDAVVWLAGVLDESGMRFDQAGVAPLACPILLVTGDADSYGATEDTQRLHSWLPDSELVMLPSPRHGTDILLDGGVPAEQLETAFLDFVDEIAATASPTPCTP